jgi:ABC-type glutathione transport system ATPase component
MLDYFGNLRSPLWDQMEQMGEENEAIELDMPSLKEKVAQLEKEFSEAKRKSGICAIF